MILGVYARELGPVFAEALRGMGVERALVVCGMESLDEISIAGGTWVRLSYLCVIRYSNVGGCCSDGVVGLVVGEWRYYDYYTPSFPFRTSNSSLKHSRRSVT